MEHLAEAQERREEMTPEEKKKRFEERQAKRREREARVKYVAERIRACYSMADYEKLASDVGYKHGWAVRQFSMRSNRRPPEQQSTEQ